jgi:hypothetical protein
MHKFGGSIGLYIHHREWEQPIFSQEVEVSLLLKTALKKRILINFLHVEWVLRMSDNAFYAAQRNTLCC